MRNLKLSDELASILRKSEKFNRTDKLHVAIDTIQGNYDLTHLNEMSKLIVCYGPDTTVAELLDMAVYEEPKPVEWGKIFGKLAFWR